MLVRITAKSHNPDDKYVPRLHLQLPVGEPKVHELTDEQVATLEADPWLTIESVDKPEKGEAVGDNPNPRKPKAMK